MPVIEDFIQGGVRRHLAKLSVTIGHSGLRNVVERHSESYIVTVGRIVHVLLCGHVV